LHPRPRADLQIPGIEPRAWKPAHRERNVSGAANAPLVEFVVSLNLHRRHLTPSQRAFIAVDMLPFYEEEARERQKTSTGGKHPQLNVPIGPR
jgi:hypothetical protein